MKCFRLIFSLLIFGCIAFTSCKTNVSTTDSLALIPGDATMVVEVNGNTIFAKSGLDNPDNYNFMKFLKLMDNDVSKFIESFFKGSKEAGISAGKVLFYMTKLPDYAVIFPMLDKTAFENWLKKSDAPEPKDGDKFRYISIEKNLNLAWTDKWAVISGASSREQIAELFEPKNDDGLLATSSDFQQFAKKNADSRLWIQGIAFIDIYKAMLSFNISNHISGGGHHHGNFDFHKYDDKFIDEIFKDYANLSTHSYLNSEDGKITGSASFYPPEEVEKLKEKYPVFKKSFNTEIIKDMPEQSYLAFNTFIDVKEYIKLMQQNIERMLSGGNMPEIEGKSEELFKFFDSPELKSVVEALGGDILLSIHGFNKGMFTYPLASASFTVNGESAFNDILKLIPNDFYKKNEDGYYSTFTNKTFIPVYFAYKKNKVFVSNDLDAIKAFKDGAKGKTFADNPVSKIMTDKMVFYINLDYATYPENIKMLAQNFMGDGYKVFTSFIDIFECTYFSGDTNYNMEFSLQLKNKNVNALKQILKNIDKASSSAWTN
jgi:hypothetical protein